MFTPLLWAILVQWAFWAQQARPGYWEQRGALDAQAVFNRGEWWRLGSALFLHADIGHLISNELSGIFAFSAVLTTLGRRRGWLLIALASVTGNLAIAALHYPGIYRSIGASTAIFAALGLLTGRAIRLVGGTGRSGRFKAFLVPFGAGIAVLGLFGAGGVDIDAGAHLTGFLAGLLFGVLAGAPRSV